METTVVYWGNIRIMEKKMETSIMGYLGFRVMGMLVGEFMETTPAIPCPIPY